MGESVWAPLQLNANEKVLADDSISNSFPVIVHEDAAESEPIVASGPSSFETVNVQPSGVTPEGGTL